MRWAIVTGGYPPQVGGVSDYTRVVARGLVEAGDEVHVWTSACAATTPHDRDVFVHRLPGHFGLPSLRSLHQDLSRLPRPYRVLVQYVPHAFGARAMNLPFCLWLYSRRRDDISTVFHEVAFPFHRRQRSSHRALALVTHVMAAIVLRASRRVFVTIPGWEPMLRGLSRRAVETTWLPVPSTVPTHVDAATLIATRSRLGLDAAGGVLGHFGTYAPIVGDALAPVLAAVLRANRARRAVLVGGRGVRYAADFVARHPELREGLIAPGGGTPEQVAAQLAACDVLLQPYPDGVSSRRTSLMAGLALGKAIVTTEGSLSESLWRATGAVRLAPVGCAADLASAATALLDDPGARNALGARAEQVYAERFAVGHTVQALRG